MIRLLCPRGQASWQTGAIPRLEADLRRCLELESRRWVAGRAHAGLGKLADLRGDRAAARQLFTRAVELARQDNDPIGEAAAGRWVDTPFRPGQ